MIPLSSKLESTHRYCQVTGVLNQSMKFIFQKHHQKKFLKQQKNKSTLSFRRKKTLILKNPTGLFPSNQTNKEGNPVEFLRFHVYNSIHPITTGMTPIRNMNHKRKYLLNQSQEYQLQYLLSKEESFQ